MLEGETNKAINRDWTLLFRDCLDGAFGNFPSRESRFLSHCELGENIIRGHFLYHLESGAKKIRFLHFKKRGKV